MFLKVRCRVKATTQILQNAHTERPVSDFHPIPIHLPSSFLRIPFSDTFLLGEFTMSTHHQQARDRATVFIVEFLRQHVPLDLQREAWSFTFSQLDVAFLRYCFKKKHDHGEKCPDCSAGRDCLFDDALQVVCPSPVTGTSEAFHRHILAIAEFDALHRTGTLFPPAFGPFRPVS